MMGFAAAWNAALVLVAALSLAFGDGALAALIIGSMVVTAVLTTMAARIAESIVEALPFLTGAVGTITMVAYWALRIDYAVNKLFGG